MQGRVRQPNGALNTCTSRVNGQPASSNPAELGVGVMSLYRYVSGRQEMEQLAVDLVFSTVDPDVAELPGWPEQVTELAGRFRAAVARHPAVIQLLLAHYQSSASALRWSEAVLDALACAGLDGRQQV